MGLLCVVRTSSFLRWVRHGSVALLPIELRANPASVLAVNVVFLCIITFYRFFVRRENCRLDAGGEEARAVMRRGVTEEQMSLGWRFVGY